MDFDAADQALARAIGERAAISPRPDADEDAIALRAILAKARPEARAVLKAAWGRFSVEGRVTARGGTASILAADRYGAETIVAADTPEAALKAARDGGRAVLDLNAGAWWGRLLAEPALRIVAVLPDDAQARPLAAVIERRVGGPTGDDVTLWVTDSAWSEAAIIDHFSGNGLAATPLLSLGGLKLFSLAGYVQAHDARLSAAPGRLSGVIGSAPVF